MCNCTCLVKATHSACVCLGEGMHLHVFGVNMVPIGSSPPYTYEDVPRTMLAQIMSAGPAYVFPPCCYMCVHTYQEGSSQPSSILGDPTCGPIELGMMSFLP